MRRHPEAEFQVVDGLDLFNRVPGWRLHMAHLSLEPGDHERVFDVAIKGTLASIRRRFPAGAIAPDATLDAVRTALEVHAGGPAPLPATSEQFIGEILGGSVIPRRHPALVFRDLLLARTRLPWSVFDARKVLLPMMYRLGEPGEADRDRGIEVSLENVPLLCDGNGIVASPCTYHGEARIVDDTTQVIVVCYTPMSIAREYTARTELARLVWMTWAFKFVEERAFRPPE